jgi:hypothetical protein
MHTVGAQCQCQPLAVIVHTLSTKPLARHNALKLLVAHANLCASAPADCRAFSVIEGIALGVDPDYAIVLECMPYIARRLLSDDSPRARAVLRQLLYGDR